MGHGGLGSGVGGVVSGLGGGFWACARVMRGLRAMVFGGCFEGFDVGYGGFAGWRLGFWGSVSCAGAWGFGCGGWGVVLGLDGLVFCLRGVVLDLRWVGFGNVVLGLGVGQVGFAG